VTTGKQRDPRVVDPQPFVAISILNWNDWRDTLECLESVRRLDYPNYLTVAVDNASWDGSAEKIKAWAEAKLGPEHVLAEYSQETALKGGEEETERALGRALSSARLVLIRNQENLGFTGGNNASISYALCRPSLCDYVFLLNNDAVVEPDCLAQLVAVDQAADAGAVVATFKSIPDLTQGTHAVQRAKAREAIESCDRQVDQIMSASGSPWVDVPWVGGGALLLRRDLLEALREHQGSYLDQRLFMYLDDLALSLAAQKLGYSTVQASRAIAYHTAATSSGGRYSAIEYYYGTRNSIHLAAQRPARQRLRFHLLFPIKTVGRMAKNLIYGRPGAARAVFWGLVDGYRGVTGKWRDHDREAPAATVLRHPTRAG
jgi:hypothetical protein